MIVKTPFDKARNHVPAEGRVPGFFLFSWSPVRGQVPVDFKDKPENGARDAVDRLAGAMGHAGMEYLAKQLYPEGVVRYVARYDHPDGYKDGGLFVPYSPQAVAQLLFILGGTFLHLKFPAVVVNHPLYDETQISRWLEEHFRDQTAESGGDTAELELLGLEDEIWDFPCGARPTFERYTEALFERCLYRMPCDRRVPMRDAVRDFVEIVAPDWSKQHPACEQNAVLKLARRYAAMLSYEEPEVDEADRIRRAAAYTVTCIEGLDRSRLAAVLGLFTQKLPTPVGTPAEAVSVAVCEWLVRRLSEQDE